MLNLDPDIRIGGRRVSLGWAQKPSRPDAPRTSKTGFRAQDSRDLMKAVKKAPGQQTFASLKDALVSPSGGGSQDPCSFEGMNGKNKWSIKFSDPMLNEAPRSG